MSGTIALASSQSMPGGLSAGTHARYCSWAVAPYASHHARWKFQREKGVGE